jgi:hypothetical protein
VRQNYANSPSYLLQNNSQYSGLSQYASFSPLSQIGITTPQNSFDQSSQGSTSINSGLLNTLQTIVSNLISLLQGQPSPSNTPAFDRSGSGNGNGSHTHGHGNGHGGQGKPGVKTETPGGPFGGPAPSPTTPSPTTPTPGAGDSGNVQTNSVNGGGPNELVLKNTDSKPMTIALFENTGPGMSPNLNDPNNRFTVQPGQTLKLAMPASWQGRAQKLSGNPTDPASWAEINYEPAKNGGNNKIWYDLSLIRGYNSAVTMKPTHATDDSELGGSSKSILAGAPADAVTTDAGGNKVIKDTEGFDGGTNQAAINYFNSAVGNDKAYVRNWDNNAVRTTEDNSLTVTFGAA